MYDQEYGGYDSEYSEQVADSGPCGKLCGGFATMCIGIFAFPIALFLLGWNENRYVCEDKKIIYAEAHAKPVGCDASKIYDTFAFFSCPLDPASMERYQLCTFNEGKYACDNSVVFRAPSASQVVEMYQCHEDCKTEKKKNNLGQNVETRTCTYKPGWYEQPIDSSTFHASMNQVAANCPGFRNAGGNPRFPDNLVPGTTSDSASTLRTAGAAGYTLNHDLVERLTPNAPVALAPYARNFSGPLVTNQPWTRPLQVTKSNLAVNGNYLETCGAQTGYQVGCVRISFMKSAATQATVVAFVTNSGRTQAAQVPGSWGCSRSHMQEIAGSKMTKEGFIKDLHDKNYTMTWIVRFAGMIFACMAVCCCLQPIAAAADVLGDFVNWCPCGGFVEDAIEGLVDTAICCVGCSTGMAASMFVIALVWVAMRPMWGIGFLVVGCCCCCGACGTIMACRKNKGGIE